MNLRVLLFVIVLCVYHQAQAWLSFEQLSPVVGYTLDRQQLQQFEKGLAASVKGDREQARALLLPLAEKGNADAQSALGLMLQQSWSVQDKKQAYRWLYFAALQGDYLAQLKIARAYLDGAYVPKNIPKAYQWLKKAGRHEHSNALLQEQWQYFHRFVLETARQKIAAQAYRQAEKLLLLSADSGNKEAQFALAELYQSGKPESYKQAFAAAWYQKAADQGVAEAQYKLAMSTLRNSKASADEHKKALEQLQAASSPGSKQAQYKLGLLLLSGKFGKKDTQKGIQYLRLAAEQNNDAAQYALGVYYSTGKNVKQDYHEAHNWFKKAAKLGNAKAAHNLALTYLHGLGVKKDQRKAQQWLSKATRLGNKKSGKLLAGLQKKEKSVSPAPQSTPVAKTLQVAHATAGKAKKPQQTSYYQAIEGLDWIKQVVKKPRGYTLQLIAVSNESRLKDFLKKYNIKQQYFHYVRNINQTGNVHVVLYGYFERYRAAYQRAVELSDNFTSIKPWIRQIEVVRDKVVRKVALNS